jgi:hypothetical protein
VIARTGGEVHAVDEQQRAGVVDGGGDRRQVRAGAEEVRGPGDGDQPGAAGEQPRHVVRRQLGGGGVEVRPADGRAGRRRGVHPGADVRVVVQAGDDDLVARAPVLGERAGEVVGELGHAAAEDDAAGVGGEQVGDGGAGGEDDAVRAALGRGDGASVGDRGAEGGGDGVRHDVRRLRAARAVEVRGALRQGREVRADGGDVVPGAGDRAADGGVGGRGVADRGVGGRGAWLGRHRALAATGAGVCPRRASTSSAI